MHPEIIINKLSVKPNLTDEEISRIFRQNPSDQGYVYSKSKILEHYNNLNLELSFDAKLNFLANVTMKKVRTLSGVTTVTVLTKPFPCPGKCIFCPNDVRMPKSYISSEPGAQRAKTNAFDPYLQAYNRLLALHKIGHTTDKVELIILGGTWTSYPLGYQIWFVKRCFEALNDFDPAKILTVPAVTSEESEKYEFSEVSNETGAVNYNLSVALPPEKAETATWGELFNLHKINESAKTRCIGLSIETRPDEVTKTQVENIRKLGVTKVQIGIQSLNDTVLRLNKRGHTVAQSAKACSILRRAGFKIQAHYMPNLYGASVNKDIADFKKLFKDKRFRPDELKLYPCSLIDKTELMTVYREGKWRPYSKQELLTVLSECLKAVPRYCRVTRVIRDIPSHEIFEGNKLTNLRQLVEQQLDFSDSITNEIRKREIKGLQFDQKDLKLKQTRYQTATSKETFLEYVTPNDKIAGFLRLSFPTQPALLKDLKDCAIIREVHIYGQSLNIGKSGEKVAQHTGLGTKLIQKAILSAKKAEFKKLAVISSVGTRLYYKKFGFKEKRLYQVLVLS